MSIIYCDKHDLRWDSDFKSECPHCESKGYLQTNAVPQAPVAATMDSAVSGESPRTAGTLGVGHADSLTGAAPSRSQLRRIAIQKGEPMPDFAAPGAMPDGTWIDELLRRLGEHHVVGDEELADCIRQLRAHAEALQAQVDRSATILRDNLALANSQARERRAERDGIIKSLRERYSAIEISNMAGLTRQRVHQILKEPPVEITKPDRLALIEENEQLQSRLSEAYAALVVAKDALYNAFEPDNQSKAYHTICATIAAAGEGKK